MRQVDVKQIITDKERLNKLCNEFRKELEPEEDLKAKLAPLINTNNVEVLLTLDDAVLLAHKKLRYLFDIASLTSENTNSSPKQKAMLDLYAYLTLVEGVFSEMVEIIAFLLIENDHDLYDPKEMRFIDSYLQLKKLDLFVKIQFIEKHGFKNLTNAIDRNLRNCIAHLDFLVDEMGNITNTRTGEIFEYNENGLNNKITKKFVYALAVFGQTLFIILDCIGHPEDSSKTVKDVEDYILIEDKESWSAIVKHGTGFIYNDFGSQYPGNSPSWNTKENNKLHKIFLPSTTANDLFK